MSKKNKLMLAAAVIAALLLVGMAAAKRLMGAAHVRSGAVQAEEPAF